jgi:hypothetical protein
MVNASEEIPLDGRIRTGDTRKGGDPVYDLRPRVTACRRMPRANQPELHLPRLPRRRRPSESEAETVERRTTSPVSNSRSRVTARHRMNRAHRLELGLPWLPHRRRPSERVAGTSWKRTETSGFPVLFFSIDRGFRYLDTTT